MFCPVQQAIFREEALRFPKLLLSAVQAAGIAEVKVKQISDLFFVQISDECIFVYGFLNVFLLLTTGNQHFFPAGAQPLYLRGRVLLRVPALIFHEEHSQICLAAFGVHIQRTVEKVGSILPLFVFKSHIAAVKQRLHVGPAAALLYDNGLLVRLMLDFFGSVCREHLVDAADKLLNKADFAHVIAHQHRKLLRQVIWVHVPVAGNEQLSLVLAHHGKKTAPLVLDPDGVEVFTAGANSHHDLCRVERGEYVRLILCAGYIFQ